MVDTLMKTAASKMTTYQLPGERTRVEIAFPRECAGCVMSIEIPKDSFDDVRQEAIQRLATSLEDNIQRLKCSIQIKHMVQGRVVIWQKQTARSFAQYERILNRAVTMTHKGRGLEIVTIGSLAKHHR